jgi:hypothetical protein
MALNRETLACRWRGCDDQDRRRRRVQKRTASEAKGKSLVLSRYEHVCVLHAYPLEAAVIPRRLDGRISWRRIWHGLFVVLAGAFLIILIVLLILSVID